MKHFAQVDQAQKQQIAALAKQRDEIIKSATRPAPKSPKPLTRTSCRSPRTPSSARPW